MHRIPTIIGFLLFFQNIASAQLPYQARVDSIQRFFLSPEVGEDIYAALAKMRSREHREEGIALFDRLTFVRSLEILDRFRITSAYLHASAILPDTLKERVEQLWATIPVRPFMEEYERVIYYTSLYLCTRHFPTKQVWFNGRSTEENAADAKGFLMHWIRDVTEWGQQEYDSPTYAPLYITSMLLLRDFSRDAELRTLGDLMTQWLLADYFHEYFGGQFGGSHGREELFSAMVPVQSEMSALAWLIVGDGIQLYGREQYLASLSDFRAHPVILELASQKFQPFEAFELKRSANRLRGDSVENRPVIKYAYVDPLYIVGSMPGGIVQPREQHSWDVTWLSDKLHTTLFTMQPYSETSMLKEFYPHRSNRVERNVANRDLYFGTPGKTVGGSPVERIFQYKNTVIALYDISGVKKFPMVMGWLPREVESFDVDSLATGWITIDAGDVYVAYYPLQPYTIYEEEAGRRLVSRGEKNGAIVQVAGRNAAGSYKNFRTRILKSTIDRTQFESHLRIQYTTPNGDVLDATYDGSFKVNGRTPSVDTTLLFNSPWIRSKAGSGVMRVTGKTGAVTIDIPERTIR